MFYLPVSGIIIFVLVRIDELIGTGSIAEQTQVGQVGKVHFYLVDENVNVVDVVLVAREDLEALEFGEVRILAYIVVVANELF